MHKQVKAFYDMANDYHIAATSLWVQIIDAPYLFSPLSFLLRHTIELQLKGLIVLELMKDYDTLKISDIKMPAGKPMDSTHSVYDLWKYYRQLYTLHSLLVNEREFKICSKVLSKLDKKDFSSARYRYPFTKEDVFVNYEPIDISFTEKAPDISTGIPSVVISGTNIGVVEKGQRLIKETQEIFDVVEFLFGSFEANI